MSVYLECRVLAQSHIRVLEDADGMSLGSLPLGTFWVLDNLGVVVVLFVGAMMVVILRKIKEMAHLFLVP